MEGIETGNIRHRMTQHGTKYSIEEWICPICEEEKSTLYIDGEWCHGDSMCSYFSNVKSMHGCAQCILKETENGKG